MGCLKNMETVSLLKGSGLISCQQLLVILEIKFLQPDYSNKKSAVVSYRTVAQAIVPSQGCRSN